MPHIKNKYKVVFYALIIFLLFFLPFISFDFGITCDEILHQTHGKFLFKYYKNESNIAVQSPFTASGNLPPLTSETPADSPNWSRMNIYGGIFDFLCNVLYEVFPFFGEYETRHLLGALVGVFTMLLCGLFAKELGGWRAGLFALIFMAASPRFIAHSMNNPKDLPFAAMYIFSLYHIILFLKEYPVVKLKRIVWLAIGISLAISVRVSGILLLCYLLFFTVVNFFSVMFEKIVSRNDFKKMFLFFLGAILIAFLGYAGAWIFWPYTRNTSFFYPLYVLKEMSNFDIFDSYNLFSGKWIHRWEIPWNYIPQWIWVTIPLFISAGLLLTPTLFIRNFHKTHLFNRKHLVLLIFAITCPILFVIINKSNVLDEYRHLLFVYPPMVVICALSWETLLKRMNTLKIKIPVYVVLAAFIIEPVWWMTKNHPNECVYFSPLIGGVDGAFKNYETDYWGNSLRAAAEWIGKNKQPINEKDTIKVAEYYIQGISASYYLKQYKNIKLLYLKKFNSDLWDYWIYLASAAKHQHNLLLNWPPPGTIHEIKADDTPLCAIMVNPITRKEEYMNSCTNRVEEFPTSENFFQLGFAYSKMNMFEESIAAYNKSVALNPRNADALNNIGAVYLLQNKWAEAIEYSFQTLEIISDYTLAKNNLSYALQKKLEEINMNNNNAAVEASVFVNKSVQFYNEQEYEKCIATCEKALELNPSSLIAYNNIGISQYKLQNYTDAERACKRALFINPGFELAKNNLQMIQQKLKENN